jgi:hypothetical protein
MPAWKPGQTGNPKGKRTGIGVSQLGDLARTYTETAIATLAEICQDPKAPSSARVGAASVLLDRGWGKAPQEVTITDGIDVTQLSDSDLDASIAREIANLAATLNYGKGAEEDSDIIH